MVYDAHYYNEHLALLLTGKLEKTTHAELAKSVTRVEGLRPVGHDDLVDEGGHEVCDAGCLDGINALDVPQVVEVIGL